MLLFVLHKLWSIIDDAGFVVSSVVASHPALLSFPMLAGNVDRAPLDGSDFLKQGQESVGVKRQYCGEVGKRANCQAGVYLGYASRQGYTLLDRRLSVPQEWVEHHI